MAHKKWDLIFTTDSQEEFNRFFMSLPKKSMTSTKSNVDCYAGKCFGNHKGTIKYYKCTAQECDHCGSKKCSQDCNHCTANFRLYFCHQREKWYFYQEQETANSYEQFNDPNFQMSETKVFGIP